MNAVKDLIFIGILLVPHTGIAQIDQLIDSADYYLEDWAYLDKAKRLIDVVIQKDKELTPLQRAQTYCLAGEERLYQWDFIESVRLSKKGLQLAAVSSPIF